MNRLTVMNSEGIGVLKQPFQCERCGDLQWSLPDLGEGSPTDRLAEYEDIGLLPAQIKEIDKLYTEKCEELAKIQKEYLSGMELVQIYAELRKLNEYKKLDKQGRLLKLPCKVGDTYFEIEKAFWRNEQECKGCRYYHTGSDVFRDDDCCLFEEEKWPPCAEIVEKRFESVKEIISCMEDGSVGKTIFFVREEAEAALKSQESRNKV